MQAAHFKAGAVLILTCHATAMFFCQHILDAGNAVECNIVLGEQECARAATGGFADNNLVYGRIFIVTVNAQGRPFLSEYPYINVKMLQDDDKKAYFMGIQEASAYNLRVLLWRRLYRK